MQWHFRLWGADECKHNPAKQKNQIEHYFEINIQFSPGFLVNMSSQIQFL